MLQYYAYHPDLGSAPLKHWSNLPTNKQLAPFPNLPSSSHCSQPPPSTSLHPSLQMNFLAFILSHYTPAINLPPTTLEQFYNQLIKYKLIVSITVEYMLSVHLKIVLLLNILLICEVSRYVTGWGWGSLCWSKTQVFLSQL